MKKPYHITGDGSATIYQGDALRLMKEFESETFDMIFADPPYFGCQSGQRLNRTDGYGGNVFSTGKAIWASSRSLRKQFEFHYAWLREAQRLLKKGGTLWVTGTYHSIGVVNVVLHDLGFKILNDIILYKNNAPPNFTGSCFRAVTETMLWAKRDKTGRTKFNYRTMKAINGGKQMKSLWEYTAIKNPFRHPATKQSVVLELAILAGTNENDLILDPFAGSGTTGFVGTGLLRKCVLIEIDAPCCKLIKDRLRGKYGKYSPSKYVRNYLKKDERGVDHGK